MLYSYDETEKLPDGTGAVVPIHWRTDWRNIDERRRVRARREAGGASRDLVGRV